MILGNDILIPLKIYMLFRNRVKDKDYVIKILNICVDYVLKNENNIHRKLFYILANAELYRKLKDDDQMMLNRNRAKDICSDETFHNYMLLVDETVVKANARNPSTVDDKYVFFDEKKIDPIKGDPKVIAFESNNETIFYTEQDSTNIPCDKFGLSLDDIEPHRDFLENTSLMDIIKSHLPYEIQQDIKYLK